MAKMLAVRRRRNKDASLVKTAKGYVRYIMLVLL